MLKKQIVVGKAYVNEDARILREVVEELDRRQVKVNTFDLTTGSLIPTRHQTCRKRQLARWADREASPPETARIHPYREEAWFEKLPCKEQAGAELERVKTRLEAVAGHLTFPRYK